MIDKILNTKVVSIVVAVWMAFHIFIALQGDLIWQVFATLSLIGVVSYTLDSASSRKLLMVFGIGFLATTSEFLYHIFQKLHPFLLMELHIDQSTLSCILIDYCLELLFLHLPLSSVFAYESS